MPKPKRFLSHQGIEIRHAYKNGEPLTFWFSTAPGHVFDVRTLDTWPRDTPYNHAHFDGGPDDPRRIAIRKAIEQGYIALDGVVTVDYAG